MQEAMNKKRRLVYITNDSWWDTDVSVLPDLSRECDLEVFCLSPKDAAERKFREKSLPEGVKFHDCRFGRSKKDPRMALSSFFYGIRILSAIRGKTAVWVLDNNIWYGYLFIALASAARVIVSVHNYSDHTDARAWERKMKEAVLRKFLFFHFQSPMQESVFKNDYPDKRSFSTVMQVKDFGSPSGRVAMPNNGRRTYLFFGYLRDYKRPDLFIKASEILDGKANFVMAGTGENLQKYRDMIKAGNSIKCCFRLIDDGEIPDYFANADFLVLPYEDSTQSGPLLIAYNYGLPVIASRLPYFSQMIDNGVTGFLFDSGEVNSLVGAIEQSLAMSNNEYREMRIATKAKADSYKVLSNYSESLVNFLSQNGL